MSRLLDTAGESPDRSLCVAQALRRLARATSARLEPTSPGQVRHSSRREIPRVCSCVSTWRNAPVQHSRFLSCRGRALRSLRSGDILEWIRPIIISLSLSLSSFSLSLSLALSLSLFFLSLALSLPQASSVLGLCSKASCAVFSYPGLNLITSRPGNVHPAPARICPADGVSIGRMLSGVCDEKPALQLPLPMHVESRDTQLAYECCLE